MKKTFDSNYIKKHRGCYQMEEVDILSFIGQDKISIMDILNSEITLKNKGWFVIKKTQLTTEQKKQLAYLMAVSVAPNTQMITGSMNVLKPLNNLMLAKYQLIF